MKKSLKKYGIYINLIVIFTLIFTFHFGMIYATENGNNSGASTPTNSESSGSPENLIPNQDISTATSTQEKNPDGTTKTDSDGKPVSKVPAGVSSMLGEITNILAAIAGFVCVFKLIQIGIMFVLTGANDRSNAKTSLLPWIIGTVVCGGYLLIGNSIISIIQGAAGGGGVTSPGDPGAAIKTLGEEALDIIGIVAWFVAIGMVIYIGIKYIFTGAGGMAKVKTTLFPLIVGLVIIGSASQIASAVVSVASSGGDMKSIVTAAGGTVISLLKVVASAAAFGMLIFIGIKYMLKGAGAKAEVKSTILPWLIGCILVASASIIVEAFLSNGSGGGAVSIGGGNTATTQQSDNSAPSRRNAN